MLLFILTIIILIGYIHAPHHASAILIFYAISVLVFVVTYRAAYYNIVHCFRKCKRSADKRTGTTTSDEPVCDLATCIDPIKKHTIRCVLCICCAKYFNPENSGISCIGRRLSFWEDGIGKSVIHSCLLFTFVVLSFFLSGILVFVVVLFLIVPINLAIDDAPNRLLNINQTILIFTTLAITYKLYQFTILDQLVKANTKKLKQTPLPHTPPTMAQYYGAILVPKLEYILYVFVSRGYSFCKLV